MSGEVFGPFFARPKGDSPIFVDTKIGTVPRERPGGPTLVDSRLSSGVGGRPKSWLQIRSYGEYNRRRAWGSFGGGEVRENRAKARKSPENRAFCGFLRGIPRAEIGGKLRPATYVKSAGAADGANGWQRAGWAAVELESEGRKANLHSG